LIFAADNDHHLPLKKSPTGRQLPNVGLEKAEEAARAVNGTVAIPAFERGNPGTDWNDYAAQHGLGAVAGAFGGLLRSASGVSDAPWDSSTTGGKARARAVVTRRGGVYVKAAERG
jgi:phage/plasmid primase-like uncharacterized protein